MKKRIFALLFGFVWVFAQMTAFADVIFEPMEDDFYQSHMDECEYIGRVFIANGEKGFVEIQKSPESNQRVDAQKNGNPIGSSHVYVDKVDARKNGDRIWISHVYVDEKEKTWGYVDNFENSGWVDMQGMIQTYDNIAFYKEHKAEFQRYHGELDAWIEQGGDVAIYSFPGSDSVDTLQVDQNLTLTETYTDPEGRLWGYSAYYYGYKQNWICISDPANADLPVTERVYEGLIPAVDPPDESEALNTPETANPMWTTTIAVALVVALTAVLILRFWKISTN